MNQLGPIFKEARVESGKSIDDAVKETKIAKKYLLAIENENFDIFPGETYLIGFIRNYSQFLGLDPDEMVLKYRDYKIQEQPAPIEQLTAKTSTLKRFILIGITFVIIVSSVLFILLTGDRSKKVKVKEEKVPHAEVEEEKEQKGTAGLTVFEEEEIIRDFVKGDVIEIPVKNAVHRISIDGIDENLEFSIEDIPFILSTDERVEIDFDRDGRKDILLRINRMGEGIVNLTLKKIFKTESSDLSIGLTDTETATAGATAGPPEVVIIKEDELFADIPVAPKSGFHIVSGYEKTDIKTAIRGVSTAYVAYDIDEGEKQEILLRNGDELAFTAKDVVRIMAANARGINIQINDVSVTLGKGGETVAKVVRWYRDSDDSDLYHLIIDDWE
ncbi:MAG: helix-turn-helix domain-containing protein [Spirochaetes bacterium]|nr:helix-turn-helix domain-containing protein [Spirochaetota bacterium]